MAKAKERTFRVKYDKWPVREATIAASTLEGLSGEEIARRVMPKAFEQHLDKFGGDVWTDAKDRKIVLVSVTDGLWEGKRIRDNMTEEDWYIMETTAQ